MHAAGPEPWIVKRLMVAALVAAGALVAGPAALADHGLPHLPDLPLPSSTPSPEPLPELTGQLGRTLRDAGETVGDVVGVQPPDQTPDGPTGPSNGPVPTGQDMPDPSVDGAGSSDLSAPPAGFTGTSNHWPVAAERSPRSAPSTLGGALTTLGVNAAALARPMGLPLALTFIVVAVIALATRKPAALKLGGERTWGRERNTWRL